MNCYNNDTIEFSIECTPYSKICEANITLFIFPKKTPGKPTFHFCLGGGEGVNVQRAFVPLKTPNLFFIEGHIRDHT